MGEEETTYNFFELKKLTDLDELNFEELCKMSTFNDYYELRKVSND